MESGLNESAINHSLVSSPTSTGGGGTFFEQHVGALFLALLLVRGICPVLKDCYVEEVWLQTEVEGWSTDDILVVAENGVGKRRKMALQVKRRFTISSKDSECTKAILDFWDDFNDSSKFNSESDCLALVVLRGTDVLLNTFNSLLDCARFSADESQFAARLLKRGHLSQSAHNQADEIRTILRTRTEPSEKDFWRFLRAIYILGFDLNTSTAQTEVWIKNLLAQTSQASQGADPSALADATWRELLELVGVGMPGAGSYSRDRLPESVRIRHTEIPSANSVALRTLLAHSQTTLEGIQTMVAHTVQMPRADVVAQALADMSKAQVLLIMGPAGSGKSVIGKRIIEGLSASHICLAFRAEEFAAAHIDTCLSFADINSQKLMGILAGQGRKVILVESVERLLEAPIRDAFSDLIHLAKKDKSLQIILTCRDYSAETVRTALIDPTGIESGVLHVPPLDDEELTEVVRAIPALSRPLDNLQLKALLRSPYFLDIAARIDWSSEETLPRDEREFRDRCWKSIIRRDAVAGDGIPSLRERAFVRLTLQRARELKPFVRANDLDTRVLEALIKDGIVVAQSEATSLVAPSHDVLEDWAILHWLNEEYFNHEGDVDSIASEIGGYPAVRRGYRKWLGELLVSAPDKGSSLVLAALRSDTCPAWFRDDTLVAMLLSSGAGTFLTQQSNLLLENGASMLARVIHILRVACKAPIAELGSDDNAWFLLLAPKGSAWTSVLQIVDARFDDIVKNHAGLILGLLEDWVASVTWLNPEPQGFEEAGRIAFGLLPKFGGYDQDNLQKRIFQVIAKIPKANPEAFKDLLDRGCKPRKNNHTAVEFATFILSGIAGSFACREFPDHMVRLAHANFMMLESHVPLYLEAGWSMDTEQFFGIHRHTNHNFFPASAYRGPFLPLLRAHPNIGLTLIIRLLNHASQWYGEQKYPGFRLEPAVKITLHLSDGAEIPQWANSRLWQLYRATSVGPFVVETALMALEQWLLDLCKIEDIDVEPWLLEILRESNNVALAAVVASICIAYPNRSGNAALALLSSPEVIWMDRMRMVDDSAHKPLADMFPISPAEDKIYESERKAADTLEHRKNDLEAMALRLQLGQHREAIWKLIDSYRAALPAVEEQSEEDKLWRLALHRMDIRGFQVIEAHSGDADDSSSPQADTGQIFMGPGEIEPDIQEIISADDADLNELIIDIRLLNWARSVWERPTLEENDPVHWQAKLVEARKRKLEVPSPPDYARGGPELIAAICVRDHWDAMELNDRNWCVDLLVAEIERNCDAFDEINTSGQKGILSSDRPAAYVLPSVLFRESGSSLSPEIFKCVSKSLTHAVQEVVVYAAEGVGKYAEGIWEDIAVRCAAALAKGANVLEEAYKIQRTLPYEEQVDLYKLREAAALKVRSFISSGEIDIAAELEGCASIARHQWHTALLVMRILRHFPSNTHSKYFHLQIAKGLVQEWDNASQSGQASSSFNFHYVFGCEQSIAQFVLDLSSVDALQICEPFTLAAARHPREVSDFLERLISSEYGRVGYTPFWEIWQAIADQFCKADWISKLSSRHSDKKLLDSLFFWVSWGADKSFGQRIAGQEKRINELVVRLPISAYVLEAYCRLLFNVGQHMTPSGFVVVANCLRRGQPGVSLMIGDTIFALENLLRPYIYGEALKLKSDPEMRLAVLLILDELVEAGSSKAFRMRDDFVTPVSASA